MTLKRDNLPAGNAFAGLVDNSAATEAASRLYEHHDSGMRFCCDSGERISPQEGRIRDARDAARRGNAKSEESFYSEQEEFARTSAIADEDFDPVLDIDPDEDYEIDMDELDISDADDETLGMLELLD